MKHEDGDVMNAKVALVREKNTQQNLRTGHFMKKIRPYMPFYILFLPGFLFYILFAYLPMAGIVIAFKDYNLMEGVFGSAWVGFDHFVRFFQNGDFWRVFENTLVISMLRTLFGFPTPIIFALMLNELNLKWYKKFIQTVSYMPHFISWVVVSGILYSFFSSTGIVNQIIHTAGGHEELFLANEKYFRPFLVGTAMWKESGWSAIIYLAALAGVDKEVYEAAMIDGAGRWRKLWNVTLPSIRNVISIMFVLSLGNVLTAGFDQVLVMINPAVASVGETIDYYVYRTGLQQVNNYSYATAVGLFKSVIALCLVLITNWGAKKIDEEGGLW